MIYDYQLSPDSSKENEKCHFLICGHIFKTFSSSELHRVKSFYIPQYQYENARWSYSCNHKQLSDRLCNLFGWDFVKHLFCSHQMIVLWWYNHKINTFRCKSVFGIKNHSHLQGILLPYSCCNEVFLIFHVCYIRLLSNLGLHCITVHFFHCNLKGYPHCNAFFLQVSSDSVTISSFTSFIGSRISTGIMELTVFLIASKRFWWRWNLSAICMASGKISWIADE